MRITIKGKRLKAGKCYHGVVSHYKISETKLIIGVVLNNDPETEYIKSIQIDQNVNSAFVKLAEALDIIDEDGVIDTDYLDNLYIIATLQEGHDNRFYIDKIAIDQKHYDAAEDTEEE